MRILLAIFLFTFSAWSYTADDPNKTVTSDGTRQDTIDAEQYADDKNQDDWTVIIGTAGGSYTWGTGVVTFNINHNCTIRGASPSSRPTILFTHSDTYCITLSTTVGKKMIFKDVILDATGVNNSLVSVSGGDADTNPDSSSPAFLIHNVKTLRRSQRAYWFFDSYGSLNGCWIDKADGISAIENQPRAHDAGWIGNTTWGNENTLLIESNVFSNATSDIVQQAYDADQAARACLRFNIFTNYNIATHGDDTSGVSNSCLQIEMYNNTWAYNSVVAANGVDFVIFMRGGSTTMCSNTVLMSGGAAANYMVKQAFGGGDSACCGFGCSQHTFSYPGAQQIGRGVQNSVEGILVGSYYWQNTWTTPVFSTFSECPNSFIDDGRDYYSNTARSSYTPLGVASWWTSQQGVTPFNSSTIAGKATITGKAVVQ